ncbi:hypothetical protein ENUP19_0047G0195 [Entamoeba nuttalli]|uniref:Uncharacterized protein n=1 Tax=Entamoeba nuttalli TaxID=412467 RepID=A0ABQ0DBJ6_9EUKA
MNAAELQEQIRKEEHFEKEMRKNISKLADLQGDIDLFLIETTKYKNKLLEEEKVEADKDK